MARESTQQWIGRNRGPRVTITYEVEKGDAKSKVELPFVVGVLADLGTSAKDRGKLSKRKFEGITGETFDKFMSDSKAGAKFEVPDAIGGGEAIRLDLKFDDIQSFRPDKLADAIPETRELMEENRILRGILGDMVDDPEMLDLLDQVGDNPERLQQFLDACRRRGFLDPNANAETGGPKPS